MLEERHGAERAVNHFQNSRLVEGLTREVSIGFSHLLVKIVGEKTITVEIKMLKIKPG